jgi:hypothetical protein
LWNGLNPQGLEGLFLVIETLAIKNYVDESYDGKTFVISCSLGYGFKWRHFEDSWRSVLDSTNARLASQGRKTLSRYHASDCDGTYGEFAGWDVEEQKTLTAELIAVLQRTVVQSFAYTLLLDDVRDVTENRAGRPLTHKETYQAAYFLAMEHLLLEIGPFLYRLNPFVRVLFASPPSTITRTMTASCWKHSTM